MLHKQYSKSFELKIIELVNKQEKELERRSKTEILNCNQNT